ncbi:WhiB family transcriptional regulator [Streptomyces uncialis]|uniref:WhiB family transcriptional regulator n=1 Tax=Streptomyces uncialis TaxID=1048205 RepID=UPI00365E67B6
MTGYTGQTPDTLARDTDWMDDADCQGYDPDLWFDGISVFEAQRVCAGCVVRLTCLEHAMESEASTSLYSRYGIFGGLTPGERVALRRARQNAARSARRRARLHQLRLEAA